MVAARKRFQTSTVLPGNGLVPWLATKGPLAYRVEQPPSRDYYFQYGWVLPGVLNPGINPRRLYRGIQKSKVFRPPLMPEDSSAVERARIWEIYLGVQAKVLSDSVLSFNSAHDRVRRCETGHIRDGSWLTDCLAREAGLPIDGAASSLWRSAHESYSLVRWVAENKFGPSYIVSETAADNVRLTTFFAGENEVRVVDPRLVKIVDARGCRVEENGDGYIRVRNLSVRKS